MYKYAVGSGRWVLSVLISPFSSAGVTLFEQQGPAALWFEASIDDEDSFLHLCAFHWEVSFITTPVLRWE